MLLDVSKLPPVLPLRVVFRAAQTQFVPAFPGSALHGALGRALWKTVCAFPRRRECAGCPLLNRCAYPALFATIAPADHRLERLGIRDQAPRPMVLAPEEGWTRPSGHPRLVEKGVEIPFRVTLIGRAIDDLALLVVALRKVAQGGIGRSADGETNGPSRFAAAELAGITSGDGCEVIYDAADEQLRACKPKGPFEASLPSQNVNRIVIRLITPLRLKRDGKVCGRPDVADFAVALARRANALAVLNGTDEGPVDEAAAQELARAV